MIRMDKSAGQKKINVPMNIESCIQTYEAV